MKNYIYALVLVFIGCSTFSEEKSIEIIEVLSGDTKLLLDNTLLHYTDQKKLAGVSALIARDGKIIYQESFGMQSIEHNRPMENNSLFRIASMTKPITAVAALTLLDQGKLDLGDLASKYIPAFKDANILQEDGKLRKAKNDITIKHLLMHTAGLLPQGHPLFREANPFGNNTLEEVINEIARLPLVHEPGEKFTYGVSTDIVGRIVEIISGVTLDKYVSEHIFKPLKMHSTYWTVPEEDISRLVSMYTADGTLKLVYEPGRQELPFAQGARGLYSTTGDYFRFAQMLLNGGELEGVRVLNNETVRLMTTDHLPEELHPLNTIGTTFPNTGFGLGIAVLTGEAKDWKPAQLNFPNVGNFPGGSYYWPGVTNTWWWADPANGVVGVLLNQSSDPAAHPVFQQFHQTYYANTIYKIE